MDWLSTTDFELSYFLQWYILLPNFLFLLLKPLVSFAFFCRSLGISSCWKTRILYMSFSAFLSGAALYSGFTGTFYLLSGILLLTLTGVLTLQQKWVPAFTLSALTLSLENLCTGILQWLSYVLLPSIGKAPRFLIQLSDTIHQLLTILLFLLFAHLITTSFQKTLKLANQTESLLLAIPVFFISLVEQIVRTTIYGDTIIVDHQFGVLFPVIDHMEMLILQLLAAASLFLSLTSFQRIHAAYQSQQTICQLQQKAKEQESYIQEAKLRHKQTQAFRHDTKNHLLILAQLLKKDQSQEAYDYLIHLEDMLEQLSCPVQTGNAAVDALLGSKLSIAKQNHIRTCCQLTIPAQSHICNTDWCIVLANALDNAIAACGQVEDGAYIRISSRKKGNLYLMAIENSCSPSIHVLPEEGTGLSNIRSIMEKNHGTFHNAVSDGVYRLELLFILS